MAGLHRHSLVGLAKSAGVDERVVARDGELGAVDFPSAQIAGYDRVHLFKFGTAGILVGEMLVEPVSAVYQRVGVLVVAAARARASADGGDDDYDDGEASATGKPYPCAVFFPYPVFLHV